MLNNWKEHENLVKEILKFDKSCTTPGSGNSKKEEDVIGESFIAQCKYTSSKSLTLNENDIDRLIDASELHNKYPLFMIANPNYNVLCIPLRGDGHTKLVLRLLKSFQMVNQLGELLSMDINLKLINSLRKKLSVCKNIFSNINNIFKSEINKIELDIDKKEESILQTDLFNKEN